MKRRRLEKGYALISAMAVGVIALSITGAMMLRMSASTTQITKREMADETLNISEAVVNHVMDAMAEVTASKTILGSTWGAELTAGELADAFMTDTNVFNNDNDFLNSGNNSNNKVKFTRKANTTGNHFYNPGNDFFDSVESSAEHSAEFWTVFKESASATNFKTMSINGSGVGSTGYSVGNPFSFESLHAQSYTTYEVQKGSLTAEVVISLVPLGTDKEAETDASMHVRTTYVNHNDLYKLKVDTYIPTKAAPRSFKSLDVILQRPAMLKTNTDPFPEAAILTEATADLGNSGTTAGACAGVACIDDAEVGDVHVNNGDLIIGAQGSVQGKATATGKVTVKTTDLPYSDYTGAAGDPRDTADVTTRITGEDSSLDNAHNSRSGADEIEIPEFSTDTSAVDGTPCVNISTDPTIVRYKDCYYDGNFVKNNNNDPKLEFEGTVHIVGNFTNKGSVRCAGTTAPCRIVIDGTAETGGNGSSNYYSSAESLYIVRGYDMGEDPPTPYTDQTNCLDIGGTPDATGAHGTLFYVENPNCGSKFHGNFEFFGALFSKGKFTSVGNASDAGIQRDTNMASLMPFQTQTTRDKSDLFPKVISWKEK